MKIIRIKIYLTNNIISLNKNSYKWIIAMSNNYMIVENRIKITLMIIKMITMIVERIIIITMITMVLERFINGMRRLGEIPLNN